MNVVWVYLNLYLDFFVTLDLFLDSYQSLSHYVSDCNQIINNFFHDKVIGNKIDNIHKNKVQKVSWSDEYWQV